MMTQLSQTRLLHSVFAGTLSCLGPLGRKLSGIYSSGDHLAIAECAMPDTGSETFIHDYAAYNFLRKYDGLNIKTDTRSEALAAWEAVEAQCRVLNDTWSPKSDVPLFSTVVRKISEVLGDLDIDEFLQSIDHSGGASTQRRRMEADTSNKESDQQCVTLQARRLLVEVQRWCGYYSTPRVRNFSRFSTVPKDATTDRPIIIENQGNMLMQKSVGSMIRRRLRRVGIDLNDQTINQRAASNPDNGTIDLSSASDFLWAGLLIHLIPPPWADLMIALRSPFVEIDGRIHELQKIGGMGNGFIFELESLIFYAIASAAIELAAERGPCRPNHVIVYGDDIIVDASHAEVTVQALTFFGFKVNQKKSFWTGPFRESCGSHYYNGKLITPIYIKHFDFTFGAWYHLYNSLSTLADRIDIDLSKQLAKIEHFLRSEGEWNYVPPSYGLRAGIHAPFDIAVPTAVRRPKRGPWVQGWKVRTYSESHVQYVVCQTGAYLQTLRRIYYRDQADARCVSEATHRHKAIYMPPVLDPIGDYYKTKGCRKFGLRAGTRPGPGKFSNTEISWW